MSKLKEYSHIIKEQKILIQNQETQIGVLKHDQAVAQSQKQIDGQISAISASPVIKKQEVQATEAEVEVEVEVEAETEEDQYNNNEGGTGGLNELENCDFQYNANMTGQ